MKRDKNTTDITRALLTSGQSACILFVLIFLFLGSRRDDYSSLKYPVSSLALGEEGWMQRINFLLSGSLILVSAYGFKKITRIIKAGKYIPVYIAAAGTGLACAGIFTTDPVYGYPPAEPYHNTQFTITGHLHDMVSFFFFIGLVISCFQAGKIFKDHGQKMKYRLLKSASVLMVLSLLITGFAFKITGIAVHEIAGLFQRLTILLTLGGFYYLCAVMKRDVIFNEKNILR
jgi:hypothetical protein